MRYDFGDYATQERAAERLEYHFATGLVVEGEHPTIERRSLANGNRPDCEPTHRNCA